MSLFHANTFGVDILVRTLYCEETKKYKLHVMGLLGDSRVPFSIAYVRRDEDPTGKYKYAPLGQNSLIFDEDIKPGCDYDCYVFKAGNQELGIPESNVAMERVFVNEHDKELDHSAPVILSVIRDWDATRNKHTLTLVAERGHPEAPLKLACIPSGTEWKDENWHYPLPGTSCRTFDVDFGGQYECYAYRQENTYLGVPESNLAKRSLIVYSVIRELEVAASPIPKDEPIEARKP